MDEADVIVISVGHSEVLDLDFERKLLKGIDFWVKELDLKFKQINPAFSKSSSPLAM